MKPTEAISMLDGQLARHGETVTVRRYSSSQPRTPTDIDGVPAFVRGVKSEQLAGLVDQAASNVVLSPTAIESMLPFKTGDKIVVQGREREIESVKPIYLAGVVVRINLVVLG